MAWSGSGPGPGPGRCFPVFPKVDARFRGRGLMAPPGLSALGAKGSVRDRLTPPGRVEGSALGSYIVSLRWRGTAPSAPSYMSMPPAALRSGGRRLAVRKTIEYQIGALPRTPFPAAREFPSRGNERYEGKNSESYASCTTPAFPPLPLPFRPAGKRVTGFSVAYGSLRIQFPCHLFEGAL